MIWCGNSIVTAAQSVVSVMAAMKATPMTRLMVLVSRLPQYWLISTLDPL